MNSTSLAETDCRNGKTNFRLLFIFFPKININNLIYYFKFNIGSCFDSNSYLFLASNFHIDNSDALDNLPKSVAPVVHKNYNRIKKLNK